MDIEDLVTQVIPYSQLAAQAVADLHPRKPDGWFSAQVVYRVVAGKVVAIDHIKIIDDGHPEFAKAARPEEIEGGGPAEWGAHSLSSIGGT